MDRLLFKSGTLNNFINQVQTKLEINSSELAKLLGLSGRTIRDWRREKFKPTKKHILIMSELCGMPIPKYSILPPYWNIHKAAKLGGKKRYELYGLLGDRKTRSKGGKKSWLKRKNNSELWNKYTVPITEPKESVNLAEFIGIMLGDGGLTPFQCTIYLNSETDKEFAYYVKGLADKLFGIMPKIYIHRKHKVWRISISSVNLVKYLTRKGLCLGNKVLLQVDVPSWIKLNSEYSKACIRGLIDTDGSFVIHKYKVKGKEYSYPRLTFSNRSEPLLNFVYNKLKGLGFIPKIRKYEVCLYNQNEVKKYLEVIGVRNLRPNVKKLRWVAREA